MLAYWGHVGAAAKGRKKSLARLADPHRSEVDFDALRAKIELFSAYSALARPLALRVLLRGPAEILANGVGRAGAEPQEQRGRQLAALALHVQLLGVL